jgi:hypothetical protein
MAQAAKCRRLALNTLDEIAAGELLALAIELESEASSEATSERSSGLAASAYQPINRHAR